MRNPITKINEFLHDPKNDNFVIPALFGAATLVGAATATIAITVFTRNDVVIPAKLIARMMESGNGIIGVNTIPGYDIAVKLIPVQS